MRLSPQEQARRLPVWMALSDLFLDTEEDDADFARIRGVLIASGYPGSELRRIFGHEVLPVFAPNLLSVAGEWAGWPEDFVRDRITAHLARRQGVQAWLLRRFFARHAARCWQRIGL